MRPALVMAALVLAGCASAGGGGAALPYEALLGPWEITEEGNQIVTSTAVFLQTKQVLVQCGTVGRRGVADLPREVRPFGNGWRFRGCAGTITVRPGPGEGTLDVMLEYTASRTYLGGGGCIRFETVDGRRRCIEYDQVIRNRGEQRRRPIGMRRPGS